jgi:membrane protease YdiL (CAAX protease family)
MTFEWDQDQEPSPVRQPEPQKGRWRRGICWGPREVVQGIALGAAALIFVPVAALVVAAAFGVDVGKTAQVTEVSLAASLPFEAVLFVIAASLTVYKCHAGWDALGFRRLQLKHWWVPLAVVFTAFVILQIYAVIAEAIGGGKFAPQSTLGQDLFDKTAFVVLAGILALGMAPFIEETFFRGFVFGGLSKRFGFLVAALLSGFVFSLAHGQPTVLIPFTFIGMLFATGYAYTGSLWTTIAAHFTFNLISFGVTLANH